jgi:hypothetical protein
VTDKKTIGVTSIGRPTLQRLVDTGLFRDQMDAAKFAIGLAIAREAVPEDAPGADTIWASGNFDADGQIRSILPLLYGETQPPFRLMEQLIDAGLRLIATETGTAGQAIDVLGLLSRIKWSA